MGHGGADGDVSTSIRFDERAASQHDTAKRAPTQPDVPAAPGDLPLSVSR